MSASANSSPVASPPGSPSPAGESKPRIVRWVLFVVLLAAAGTAGWMATRGRQHTARAVPVRTVRAQRAPLEISRRVSGTIAAGRFVNISAPILTSGERSNAGMEVISLVEGGSYVKEGDVIVKIDAQSVVDHLDDVTAQVEQADLELVRQRATQKAEMESLDQRLRAAKANLDKALLDERTAEVKPAVTQDLLHLAAMEARAIYEQTATELPLTIERQLRDRNVAQIQRDRQARHRDRHRADLKRYEVRAPMNGLIVLSTLNRNGEARQMRVGEQLNPGQPILKVVDPSSMLLDGTINQAESEMFHLGQRASIRFDAYPNLHVRGKVRSVGAMAITSRRASNYIRRIPLSLSLEEQITQVIPDLSASADVIVEQEEPSLLVPRQAITLAAGKAVVYVKQPTGLFEPREVQVGPTSTTHAAILSGLSDGDEIALEAVDED